MTQYVETPIKTFVAGVAIGKHKRVYLSSGKLAIAGSTNVDIGTAEVPSAADGDEVAVRLRTAQGTCRMVAAAAITAGVAVYTAANGNISATQVSNAVLVGTALEAATNANDIIEVLRTNHGDNLGA